MVEKKGIPTLSNLKNMETPATNMATIQPSGTITQDEAMDEVKKKLDKPITYEDLVASFIDKAKKDGRVFNSDEQARKWAINKIDKIADKMRKRGIPVICKVCGKGGTNKQTGPLKRTGKDYIHQNCE